MPTLTASPRARLAAIERGLTVPQIEAANPSPRPAANPAEAKPHDVVLVETDLAKPSNKQRKRAEFLARQRAARDHLWPLLSERFPEAFRLPPRPLAIGVHTKIIEALAVAGNEIDERELSRFMRFWCGRWTYLRAVHAGEERRNLDGSAAGVPTIAERNIAGRYLWGPGHSEIKEAANAGNPAL